MNFRFLKSIIIQWPGILFFSILWPFTVTGFAQNCNPSEIVSLTGVYKGPGKGSVSGVAKSDLDRQQAVAQKFIRMVLDHYQPKGMNILYGTAHYPPSGYQPNGINTGNRYNAYFYLKYFYCDHNNKVSEIAETHSSIEFGVNEQRFESSFFVRTSMDEEDPETDVFGTIKHKPVWNEKGYWTMTDTVYTVRNMTWFHHIVTKNRELPFVYVTKKEFLEKLRRYYEKQIEVTVNTWKNSAPEDADYAKQRIEGDKSYYGKSIRNIDNFLTHSSASELNEAATVIGGGPPSEFESFSENGYWVIKPNPGYFDPKAPKSNPHFIDVLFKIHVPEVACLNAKNEILKIVDFELLKGLLGKTGSR